MVVDEVHCMLTATTLAIALFASLTFLSHHLFDEDGKGPMEFFKGENLNQLWLKFVHLRSPNICNLHYFTKALFQ
jgi:hypothetical protein